MRWTRCPAASSIASRHPVELFAQLDGVPLVLLCQPELVGRCRGPLDEQREGTWTFERGNAMDLFAGDTERFPTRGEYAGA